jgi:hypothetical protein
MPCLSMGRGCSFRPPLNWQGPDGLCRGLMSPEASACTSPGVLLAITLSTALPQAA